MTIDYPFACGSLGGSAAGRSLACRRRPRGPECKDWPCCCPSSATWPSSATSNTSISVGQLQWPGAGDARALGRLARRGPGGPPAGHQLLYLPVDELHHRRLPRTGRGHAEPIHFACCITAFPHLVAGPIIRYRDLAVQAVERTVPRRFVAGIHRFIIGLGKKTLIANTVAVAADRIFALPSAN